jgi:lysine-specific demethylase 9
VFIKKEYLPAPNKLLKIEKSREDVSRMLNFVTPVDTPLLPPLTNKSGIIVKNETQMLVQLQPKVESPVPVIEKGKSTNIVQLMTGKIETITPPVMIKKEIPQQVSVKDHTKTEERKEKSQQKIEKSTNSSTKTTSSSSHRQSSSSSSHHKSSSSSSHHSSSHKTSSSSSSGSYRDCSRCYKRSKTKHANIGIQCRRDSGKTTTTTTDANVAAITARIPSLNRELNTASHTSAIAIASGLENLKYAKYFRIEVHPNGGASFVHLYQDEIAGLSNEEMDELVDEYFQVVFSEDANGFANHVMGIVHDAAAYLPDLLEHMAENYANLTVKAGVLGRNSDIETSTMAQYNEQVSVEVVFFLQYNLIQ